MSSGFGRNSLRTTEHRSACRALQVVAQISQLPVARQQLAPDLLARR
jgi:hypothetical protein